MTVTADDIREAMKQQDSEGLPPISDDQAAKVAVLLGTPPLKEQLRG